jgi:hypothetical protein
MSDDYRRTNAILAAYREQYFFFTAARNVIAELLPNLTQKEEAEYRRIQKAVDRFNMEQQSRHQELMAAELDGFTIEQKLEYVARMLALTEQITERLNQFTEELIDLAQCHLG